MKFYLISTLVLSLVIGGLYSVFSGGASDSDEAQTGSAAVTNSTATPYSSSSDEKAMKDLKIN